MPNSRRSSHYSQSPTIVQSPLSLDLRRASVPVTPALTVETDTFPSSTHSMEIRGVFLTENSRHSFNITNPRPVDGTEGGTLARRDSFHVQTIANIKELDPGWEDDEVEEIMIISPKVKNRPSFLDLSETKRNSISDFKPVKIVGKESSVHTIVARKQSEPGLYAIKTVQKSTTSTVLLKHVRSEQACLRMVTEGGDCFFLPKLHKSFQDESRLYMVLDTFPGGSIAAQIRQEGYFSPEKARFYATEITEGLAYLHSLNIVHRDIKPENIMIASDGHIVISNFRCAKMLLRESSTSSECGSKEYDAPEKLLHWMYDYAVDVWSFGILLCIMHFGQHPFLDGDELDPLLIMQKRILRGQGPSHPTHFMPLSEWGLIKKCLERNAHLRPSMDQVKEHVYFINIDWEKVKSRGYPPPYVPVDYGDETNLLGVDEDIFHLYEKPVSPRSDCGDFASRSCTPDCDGFSFDWDESNKKLGETDKGELYVETSKSGPLVRRVQSILKRPSVYFSSDDISEKMSNIDGDFLDLRRSTSQLHRNITSRSPRKLRKKRSSVNIPASDEKSSTLQKRMSMASMISRISFRKPDDDDAPPLPLSKLVNTSVSSAALNLPKGVVQSGKGIGFHYAPNSSRSRISLSSAPRKSCFSGFKAMLNSYHKNANNTKRSRHDVMNNIYGSSWSMHTNNEAQMSTVTFTLPDGLGRRVDSIDIDNSQQNHSHKSN